MEFLSNPILRTFIFGFVILICLKVLFRFKPKRSEKLYSLVIAHRGLHLFKPENSLGAYLAAKDANMAIEIDIRQTKDNEIICFHDRYTKRLLNIPGEVSMFDLRTIKRYTILGSDEYVPTLKEALKLIKGQVDVLIEVKGKFNHEYAKSLFAIQNEYSEEMYFHTRNVFTYYKLKRLFWDSTNGQKRVYLILNIFRKRFNFVKGKDYSSQVAKYNELSSNVDVEIPSIQDISSIIVRSIEELEDKKEILATIGSIMNKYESRINLNDRTHWVYDSLWLHRGILSNKYKEHSKESFVACANFAKQQNIKITVEFDVMLYKGEVRCYHKDQISSFLGQKKSCAEKNEIENSLRLSEILEIFKNSKNVNLAIDIKDYRLRNRVLEDLIILEIKKSKFKGNFIIMSYNPMVLSYFKNVEPDWLRAQIGNSLKNFRKIPIFRFPTLVNAVLGLLFDMSCADCVVFDNSQWIFYLIAYHKNIKGKPVLIYAPKSYTEQEAFIGRESVANFIVENVTDKKQWPKEYIKQFRLK